MKKIIILFLIILSSCSRNEYEKKLIGNWNNLPNNGMTDFQFYNDSVVSTENYFSRTGKWKANESIIFLKFPKIHPDLRENIKLNYKLSNDSLLIKNDFDSIFKIPTLFKVENYWKHYLREMKMEINLPKADFKLVKNDSMDLGVNLYITKKNGKLIVKSDYTNQFNNSKILDNIEPFIYSERAIRKESEEDKMYFNLIIDKNIKKQTVDSIKAILKIFPNMNTFRVYENDKADYGKYDLTNSGEYWNWYGRFE